MSINNTAAAVIPQNDTNDSLHRLQLDLERAAVQKGFEDYEAKLKVAMQTGGLNTGSKVVIFDTYLQKVTAEFQAWVLAKVTDKANNKGPMFKLITQEWIDARTLSYISLQVLLGSNLERATSLSLQNRIGTAIRDYKLQLDDFETTLKAKRDELSNLQTLLSFDGIDELAYRVVKDEMALSRAEFENIGRFMLDMMTEAGVLTFKLMSDGTVQRRTLVFTEELQALVSTGQGQPSSIPMLVKPLPWGSVSAGGYLSIQTDFITNTTAAHRKLFERADLSSVYRAANRMQSSSFQIDQRVLAVVKELMEIEDLAGSFEHEETCKKLVKMLGDTDAEAGLDKRSHNTRIVKTALDYCDAHEIFFPVYLDWRGRQYYHGDLNPQTSSVGRNLLSFSKGCKVTAKNFKWFSFHISGQFGLDKAPPAVRFAWLNDNMDLVKAVAADPICNIELWIKASDPLGFVKACFDVRDYNADPAGFRCQTPMSVDASTSGVQILSALARDKEGAHRTNLTDAERQDLYLDTLEALRVNLKSISVNATSNNYAAAAFKELLDGFKEEARKAKDFNKAYAELKKNHVGFAELKQQAEADYSHMLLNDPRVMIRQLVKDSAMTLAYSAQRASMTRNVLKVLKEEAPELAEDNNLVSFLGGQVEKAVKEAAGSAVVMMEYFQNVLRASGDKPVSYITKLGFPVLQRKLVTDQKPINGFNFKTASEDRVRVRYFDYKDEYLTKNNISAVAANITHSIDATLMQSVILAAPSDNLMMVHDSFGTDLDSLEALRSTILEQFAKLFGDDTDGNSFLDYLHAQLTKNLDNLTADALKPELGDWDPQEVLNSSFAFS